MVKEGMVAAGFQRPVCLWPVAEVLRISLPQVELRCFKCEEEFGVEP